MVACRHRSIVFFFELDGGDGIRNWQPKIPKQRFIGRTFLFLSSKSICRQMKSPLHNGDMLNSYLLEYIVSWPTCFG
jgi:hypothetical protein